MQPCIIWIHLSVLNPDTRLSWRFTLFGQLLLHLNTNIRASLAFLFPWLLWTLIPIERHFWPFPKNLQIDTTWHWEILAPLWSRHCRSSVPPGDRTASTSAAARPQSDRAPQRRRAEAAGVPEAPRLAGATQLTQSQLRCHFEENCRNFEKSARCISSYFEQQHMSQGTDAALAQLPTQAIRANAQLDREEPQLSWSLSKLSGTLVEVVSFMMLWATFWGDSKMQQSVMRWFKAGRQESVFNPSDVECVDSYSILHQDSPEKILEEVLPGFLRLRCVVVWRLRGNSSEAGGPSRTVVPIGINLAYSGGLGSQVLRVVFGTVTWKHIIMQSLWRI